MKKRNEDERCENCDYCKHCGRSKLDTPEPCTLQHYPNYYPWWQYQTSTPYYPPNITWTSTAGTSEASGSTATLQAVN